MPSFLALVGSRPWPRWRDLPGPVLALVAARTVNRLGAFTLVFAAVVLVRDRGADVRTAGYALAAFGLATIPSRVAGGVLADRLGHRRTILVGLLGTAAAQLGFAVAPTLSAAVFCVVLLGLCFEIYEPPSQALVADLCRPAQRPAAYGLLGAAMALAGVLAGLLVAALGGLDPRWLLVADAASCLGCAAIVAGCVPRAASSRKARSAPIGDGLQSPWRDRRLIGMLCAGTAFATIYLALLVGLPLTVLHRGLGQGTVGLLFAASAATVVLGRPVLRLLPQGAHAAMACGYLLFAAGLLLTGVADTRTELIVATVVWSLGDLVLLARPYAVVAALAPSGRSAGYLAGYGLSWGLAAIAAPVLATQLMERLGTQALWTVDAVAALGLAAVQPALGRLVRCPPSTPGRR